MNAVEAAIRETVHARFPKMRIVRINTRQHTDDEGDRIIDITVVYDADKKDFDPAKLRELPRLLMPKLAKVKEDGFPLFSFVARSDLGKLKPEAA